jgi:hypothetical protein
MVFPARGQRPDVLVFSLLRAPIRVQSVPDAYPVRTPRSAQKKARRLDAPSCSIQFASSPPAHSDASFNLPSTNCTMSANVTLLAATQTLDATHAALTHRNADFIPLLVPEKSNQRAIIF